MKNVPLFFLRQVFAPAPNFFQTLRENACLLQLALKSTAPGL